MELVEHTSRSTGRAAQALTLPRACKTTSSDVWNGLRPTSKDRATPPSHRWALESTLNISREKSYTQLSDLKKAPREKDKYTDKWDDTVFTVMLRKLPHHFTQRMLADAVNQHGFEGVFDFLYVPFDHSKRKNVGYGFINFIEPHYAVVFRDSFDGTSLEGQGGKCVRVHPAAVQGYEANWQHFQNTKTGRQQDPDYSPWFQTQDLDYSPWFFPDEHTQSPDTNSSGDDDSDSGIATPRWEDEPLPLGFFSDSKSPAMLVSHCW